MKGHAEHDAQAYVDPKVLERVARAATRSRRLARALEESGALTAGRARTAHEELDRAARRGRRVRRVVALPGPGPRVPRRLRRRVRSSSAPARASSRVASDGRPARRTRRRHATPSRRRTGAGVETFYLEADAPGALRGDGARRARVRARRGRGRLRRRLQGDRGASWSASASERVLDTPLAEEAIVGAAIGAAMRGHAARRGDAVHRLHLARFRPPHELRGEEPLPHGRRRSDRRARAVGRAASTAGRTTRRSPEMYFVKTPGLKVVAPATAADAKGAPEGRDPRRRSRHLPRAQVPLPAGEGPPDPGRGLRRADRKGRRPARGDTTSRS